MMLAAKLANNFSRFRKLFFSIPKSRRRNTMQKRNTSSRDFISFQNIALHFVRKLS